MLLPQSHSSKGFRNTPAVAAAVVCYWAPAAACRGYARPGRYQQGEEHDKSGAQSAFEESGEGTEKKGRTLTTAAAQKSKAVMRGGTGPFAACCWKNKTLIRAARLFLLASGPLAQAMEVQSVGSWQKTNVAEYTGPMSFSISNARRHARGRAITGKLMMIW